MNKEMPLSVEWIPQNTYMHNSFDHLLPEDRNHDFLIIKQEAEFFQNTLNSQSAQNKIMHLQVLSKENKEIKQQNSYLDPTPCQIDSLNQLSKKLTDDSEKLYNKGRIDVIEMTVDSTLNYKYFFVYEDQFSKFVVLKALRSNTAKEVAANLLDVLGIIGAPQVLQSGNGRMFAEQVVCELRSMWNDLFILHGDTSKCEVSYRDFKSSLESWMKKNPTRTWCEGLNFIQIVHNTTYRYQNGRVPYDVLFRQNARKNFQGIGKDTENLTTEEEWIKHLSNKMDGGEAAMTEDTQSTSNNINQCEENENIRDTQSQNTFSKTDNANILSCVNVKNDDLNNVHTMDSTSTDKIVMKNELKDNEDTQSLKCEYCQKQYMKIGHLKNHIRIHKTKQVLHCKLCNKTFSVLRLFEKHMKQSHGKDKADEEREISVRKTRNIANTRSMIQLTQETSDLKMMNENCDLSLDMKESFDKDNKSSNQTGRRKLSAENRTSKTQPLKCTFCKQKFSFPSVLERHMRSHTNERPYECEVCKKSFKQLGHLSQHSLTHHDYRSFQCTVCSIKFDSLDLLKQHTPSHKGDATTTTSKVRDVYRLFECDICKKVFTMKSVLERHIFTHTQERHYDCKVCGKRFKQAGHVKSHMLVHTGERRFQCTICSKRFSLSNSLKKHMYVHNGEKPYQCDVCGARFLEKRNLNGHLLTHTNERPYCCKICGKRYTLADTLRRHVSAAHEDGRTYQCEICAKMFKQLAHLSVHKKVHNDERPFQCHLCEKNFKHKNVLKSHLAIHANVRPFECDVCKATFVRKTNLQTHISSAHMNERPYTCTICGKRFKQISHLNGHVVVHSNLMPYKCDYCDRRCNRLDNLKKHMRLHTKNKE
ncbi:PREDICTED: zinc finger protein 493-like isoform X1 [Acromyrmex echinatior]|uniref:Zinc finger protein 235 n=1 Tax=Acromyrmex echinatior TaxID=103372 RepID=F4WIK7_ACREC|nr:PREDICTED: zinc finger protein 493-like isoform X1 [Acromyrmex echinatior]EGI65943.1 Zinc finger protein 235 [Acromyrmex echinatior]